MTTSRMPPAKTRQAERAIKTRGKQSFLLHNPTTFTKKEKISGVTTMRTGNCSTITFSALQ
jgi:hypothetical protein